MIRWSLAIASLCLLALSARAEAQDPAPHAVRLEVAGAVAVRAPEDDIFGAGGGAGIAYELRFVPWVGATAGWRSFFFSNDSDNGDLGTYHALTGGVRLHPVPDLSLGDLWIGGDLGVTFTGDVARFALAAGAGFDFAISTFRVGPFVTYHHALQPDDDELGPTDARFVAFGVAGTLTLGGAPDAPEDPDGDGLLEPADRCPLHPEDLDAFEDEDGCPDPDNDADGVLDAADGCPMQAEDPDGFEDADGCPDPDNDQDGVPDASDGCPTQPEDRDGYEDADGCPDPDNDGDGILDQGDGCPLQPETPNGFQDADGCPDTAQERLDEITALVFFEYDSANLADESLAPLREVASLLAQQPNIRLLRIEGHADDRGSERYNQGLSERRARSVRDYLVRQGVAEDRLEAVGYGFHRPAETSEDEGARAQNRRVGFSIIDATVGP